MDLPVCWDLDEVSVCVQFLVRTVSFGGKIKKNGKEIRITKPIYAMKNGIAYLPEAPKGGWYRWRPAPSGTYHLVATGAAVGFFCSFSKAQANKFAERI